MAPMVARMPLPSVFDARQQVVMQLTLFGPPSDAGPAQLDLDLELLTTAAKSVSAALSRASRVTKPA